ncbi:MAG: aspartate--tRNA(Asn) ligase [Candidatus Marsarchaeota archaeon]|nr:aspartate--tRNA(Asn) ligase [Candidatus Marsarchaeota archaeon]
MIRTNYVNEITPEMDGKEVTLAGWVHEVRELGKMTFLLLRDMSGIAQIIAKKGVTDDSIISALAMPKESVISVTGTVKANKEARAGFEIIPKSVTNLNPLSAGIPFEVTGKVPAELDVRLNYRYIDLRRVQSTAIFRIESTILNAFRSTMNGSGFNEIRPSSIVAEATEGGAELFEVKYFEEKAFLAQSPQLYKQLAVIGGLDKVFMVMPVYRAEKSNDTYHINEITQMDIEMGFADHNDAMDMLEKTLKNIISDVKKNNNRELEELDVKLEVPEVKRISYEEAVESLRAHGASINPGEDFAREHEIKLSEIYGDAVLVYEYPTAVRAFYSMPKEGDPDVSNSFDMIYKGLEISSGAQRIHMPELLIEAIKRKGLDPKNFEFYVNAFRCGAPPHAGWSIGLERLAMKIVGAQNIRECTMFPRDRKRIKP